MINAYKQGKLHNGMGYSIHHNPYRHRGTAKQYIDWEDGWKSALDDNGN